jgi:hypothetical protein
MLGKCRIKKGPIFILIIIFFGASIFPSITGTYDDRNIFFDLKTNDLSNYEYDVDFDYIYNLTKNLSNIIFTEYNESAGELAKGRAFGTPGELKAGDILFKNFTKLGLYTYKEKIENIPNVLPEIASKIEILDRSLIIHNKSSGTKKEISDCYISPRGNFTSYGVFFPIELYKFKQKYPIFGLILSSFIKILPPYKNGIFDRRLNFYDRNRVSYNFSYKNLKVIHKPDCYSAIHDLSRRVKNNEEFVYIAKDTSFTEWIESDPKYIGPFYNNTIKNLPENEKFLWAFYQPNCKGLILYDSNNDTYNMGFSDYSPLHSIAVNRSIGTEIYNNPNNYKLDFYINQHWNETVESYNVVGQLNGTNPKVTVIICSLYDSWWCQGTGDAAIGQSIVVGLAKYFVENNIKPKYNIKFIAFCGEEYGFKGAYHYEETHSFENIKFILDINQVGFKPLKSKNLRFQIWTNNESIIPYLNEVGEELNYTEKTGIEFVTAYKDEGGPSNTQPFALANKNGDRSSTTILFVKTGLGFSEPYWLNHHRDGLKHKEGDVFRYYFPEDVKATTEIVLSILKNFTVD